MSLRIKENLAKGFYMNKLMDRVADHVIEKRNIYLTIAIIITIFFGWQCRKLSVKTVFADLLPQKHPYIKLHNEIRDKFGGANWDQLAVNTNIP